MAGEALRYRMARSTLLPREEMGQLLAPIPGISPYSALVSQRVIMAHRD
jgi:hypothetical protein